MQQKLQLYINDQLADLLNTDEDQIQLVMMANDLGDLATVDGNYTKPFHLPLTRRNRILLGFPDDILTCTTAPYDYYPAKVVYAGIEVIPAGKLEITQITNQTADVTVLSGNCQLMDLLGGQVYDMGDSTTPWSGYGKNKVWDQYSMPFPNDPNNLANCIWDVPHAAYSQEKTDGWIWPIIQYGDVDTQAPFAGLLNVRNQRPAFFVHTALELLIQSAKYSIDKVNSCLYNDPVYYNLYSKMLIPFSSSSFDHGTDVQNTPDNLSMLNNVNGIQQAVYPGTGTGHSNGRINFNRETYSASQSVNGTVTITFSTFYLEGISTGAHPSQVIISTTVTQAGINTNLPDTLIFTLDNNATDLIPGDSRFKKQTFVNKKLAIDIDYTPEMVISVTYQVVNSQNTFWIVGAGSKFEFQSKELTVLYTQPIQCERILPDISQIDLLKFVLQTFGLIIIANPNSATVRFISFKQIVANKAVASDWSLKCKDIGRQIQYTLGNYAQFNWLRYQYDDSIPLNLMPKYFGDDHIDISNKTLNPIQPVADLFDSLFGPSLNTTYHGGSIAQINNPTVTDQFSVGNSPRILIDQKTDLRTLGPNADGSPRVVNFADNDLGYQTVTIPVNAIISTPYFYKADPIDLGGAPKHLAWKDINGMPGLKTTYYSEFSNILTETKKVIRYFNLSPLDILDFDFAIPIYLRQDNAYYYINKIDSWIVGHPVKVELIKI